MSDTLVPPAVVPAVVVRSRCSACCLRTMLITPAMASDPYCAAAPSRSTSIRSMAAVGIAFKSTPTVPRPKVPLTCTSALEWRRLPFTRTSTWSGPRPRRLAGLMWSDPSAMVWCEALNEGASVARIWLTSVWPLSAISCAEITSTGTGVSTAVREVRAPTTTTSFNARGVAASLKSAVTACPAATVTRCSTASYPMSRARTVCAPAGTLRRYCPLSLVSTLRTVPTITTLAPASGVPDWAATVPATVPVCWAASGRVPKQAASSGRTRCELTVAGPLDERALHRLPLQSQAVAQGELGLGGQRRPHRAPRRHDVEARRHVAVARQDEYDGAGPERDSHGTLGFVSRSFRPTGKHSARATGAVMVSIGVGDKVPGCDARYVPST